MQDQSASPIANMGPPVVIMGRCTHMHESWQTYARVSTGKVLWCCLSTKSHVKLLTLILYKQRQNKNTYIGVMAAENMGWLRLVGSLKRYVCFAEYRLFYRALLQKRPVILRSLLIVATP